MDGTASIRTQVQVARATPPPAGTPALPAMAAPAYQPTVFDRIGDLVARFGHWKESLPVTGAVAGAATLGPRTPGTIRVMTYNLHGGMGGPGERNATDAKVAALAATIKREDPDIVILQELDDTTPRSGMRRELDMLTAALRPTSAVGAGPVRNVTGREQEVGVLTFHGYQVSDARDLVTPDTPDSALERVENFFHQALKGIAPHLPDWLRQHIPASATHQAQTRNALDTMVTTPDGRQVRVLGTHLVGTMASADERRTEIGSVANAAGASAGTPTLLGGDFNVPSNTAAGAEEAHDLGAVGLHDAFTTAGVPVGDARRQSLAGSGARIDRIYASSDFAVKAVSVVHEPGAPASDHRPVVSDLVLR